MSFSYAAQLRHSEIRLLVLQPAQDFNCTIHCNLVTVTTDDPGLSYESLSYTWDTPYVAQVLEWSGERFEGYTNEPRTSNLCGNEVDVKNNLFDALKRFRHSSTKRNLWVDALCINQMDDVERSQQVSIMAQIYRSTDGVLAWLGEDSPCRERMATNSLFKATCTQGDTYTALCDDLSMLRNFETGTGAVDK